MTVTVATRYLVTDAKAGMTEAKRAKAMWMKAGAKEFRVHQYFTGEFNNLWHFHIDFEDLAHLQKCRNAVQGTKDQGIIQANNAKAGNKMVAREILMGLDV